MSNGQDLGSFVKEVERLVVESRRTTVLTVGSEPAGTYLLVGPDGKAERHVSEPGWATHELDTPAELERFTRERMADWESPAVFVTDHQVRAVFDLSDRRGVAVCNLKTSVPFNWLAAASSAPPLLRQADFLRTLRVTFRGCLMDGGNLLALIRNLKFSTGSEAAANIQHGRESIAKSVQAAVTGEAALPEDVALLVQVYENHGAKFPIACALEVLPAEQAFKLTPYPMEVRRAMDGALSDIRELFESSESMPKVYRGTP